MSLLIEYEKLLINKGLSKNTMGHADVSTTMNIYAEVNNEVTQTAIENLAKNMDVF